MLVCLADKLCKNKKTRQLPLQLELPGRDGMFRRRLSLLLREYMPLCNYLGLVRMSYVIVQNFFLTPFLYLEHWIVTRLFLNSETGPGVCYVGEQHYAAVSELECLEGATPSPARSLLHCRVMSPNRWLQSIHRLQVTKCFFSSSFLSNWFQIGLTTWA